MLQPRRDLLLLALPVARVASFIFAFLLAAVLVVPPFQHASLGDFFSLRVSIENVVLFIGFVCFWHLLFCAFGLRQLGGFTGLGSEVRAILMATTVGTLAILVCGWVFSIDMMTIPFLAVFWIAVTGLEVLGRGAIRTLVTSAWASGRNIRHVLIVGTNERAVRFARRIESDPEFGCRVIGFVDNGWPGSEEFKTSEFAVVTAFGEIDSFLRNHVVDDVVVCLPLKSCYEDIAHIIETCARQGVLVRIISDFFSVKLARSKIESLGDESVLTIFTGNFSGGAIALKRAMDFVLAGLGLVALAPLLLACALGIKLTSRGPVFFVQERVGLNKRRFRMYKFRTMIPDAEKMHDELAHLNEASGPVFKMKDDPRVTRIGKLLRRTSIDELPQLFNVVRGDMSLVGPRPLPVRDYQGFDQDWHRRRFSVRPGITCLWQINGRHEVTFEEWMRLDMEYIDRWSLWLDVKVLAQTVPALIRRPGT
jgi:exopolysaccharide biosynthesis polyprenyl glycosylphosphotransferase